MIVICKIHSCYNPDHRGKYYQKYLFDRTVAYIDRGMGAGSTSPRAEDKIISDIVIYQ